jgi:hypothetical protein
MPVAKQLPQLAMSSSPAGALHRRVGDTPAGHSSAPVGHWAVGIDAMACMGNMIITVGW